MGLGGVEPPTRSLGNCCSIHLSYSPSVFIVLRILAAARCEISEGLAERISPIVNACAKFQSDREVLRTHGLTINDSALKLKTSGEGDNVRLRFGLPTPLAQHLGASRT